LLGAAEIPADFKQRHALLKIKANSSAFSQTQRRLRRAHLPVSGKKKKKKKKGNQRKSVVYAIFPWHVITTVLL